YRNRMGYGKGFYDRFLANKEELQIRSIGIGHVCQRVDEIPMDENDIKPYQVILV
ncbi:MAG: 5-formyltetrahydrofolate cyclo-ligase, partial [Acetatifactor sp.]|nr:5-formyltetrahydrofolate cyclo-ligase [Acetatifactor sp.]